MSRRDVSPELSVQSLLESGKKLPRQPESVRARVLARARAAAAAPPPVVSSTAQRPAFPSRLAASAAATALVGGAVGTLLAWSGSRHDPVATGPIVAVSSQPVAAPASAAPAVSTEPSARPADSAQRAVVAPSKARRDDAQASYNAELELMRSAHSAYAAGNYTSALVLVGEHARRFPGGLLSEEREALRIRCLLGAGRTDQARIFAESFAVRFPRSVLLHRLRAEVAAGAE